jgi:hypothetical protein
LPDAAPPHGHSGLRRFAASSLKRPEWAVVNRTPVFGYKSHINIDGASASSAKAP